MAEVECEIGGAGGTSIWPEAVAPRQQIQAPAVTFMTAAPRRAIIVRQGDGDITELLRGWITTAGVVWLPLANPRQFDSLDLRAEGGRTEKTSIRREVEAFLILMVGFDRSSLSFGFSLPTGGVSHFSEFISVIGGISRVRQAKTARDTG